MCVGLDPDPGCLPSCVSGKNRILDFCREIIDATAPYVCAFKPQIAYFAAARAESLLEQAIDHIRQNHPQIPVILDAKRGDIRSTAIMYATEAFDRYGVDAVTVNPYMGGDTLEPFLQYGDRGVFILCRTSNPSSGDLQSLECDGETISAHVARKAVQEWNYNRNVNLVVGATWPEELSNIRKIVGDMPILVPGIGTQGGDIAAVLAAGGNSQGQGLILNVARSILYASNGMDFAQAAERQAIILRERINHFRQLQP